MIMTEREKILLSIVTPTYNRADCLKACYESLRRQTTGGFEWILVDDGSTDGTEELASSFLPDSFPFRYVRKENGGKHTALNASHPFISGKYVLILDSDDTLTEDAVESVLKAWAKWDNDPEIGIVTLLKGKDVDHPNCLAVDENIPVDIMAYRRITHASNDACEVIRAELFRKYPFPVFPGEKFISEGALWNRVSLTHKCVYVNRVIYLCSYLEGGLTRSGKPLRIRNPRGGMYTANLNMAKKNGWKKRIKNGLLFTCYGCFAKYSPAEMAGICDHMLLMYACLPLGWLLHIYWKIKYKDLGG